MPNLCLKTGDTVWDWTIVDPDLRIHYGGRIRRAALVRCSCSTADTVVEKTITWDHLRSGNDKSCGHYRASGAWRPVRPKRLHLTVKVRLHVDPEALADRAVIRRAWNSVKDRCLNPNTPHYRHYGGRGISLWEPWVSDSTAFTDWIMANLGPRPDGMTLDRIDNDLGYQPGNLRWATPSQQSANQRRTRRRFAGVVRTPGASTWGYRISRNKRAFAAYGFATPDDAADARDALLVSIGEIPCRKSDNPDRTI